MKLLDKINGFKSVLGFSILQGLEGKLWVLDALKELYAQGASSLPLAFGHIMLFGGLVHKFLKEAKGRI